MKTLHIQAEHLASPYAYQVPFETFLEFVWCERRVFNPLEFHAIIRNIEEHAKGKVQQNKIKAEHNAERGTKAKSLLKTLFSESI